MAAEAIFDWSTDSPWRRLPWTLPGAILIGALGIWALASFMASPDEHLAKPPTIDAQLIELPVPQATPHPTPRQPKKLPARVPPPRAQVPVALATAQAPTPPKELASMPAPPAPTAEEWKQASTYTLKNSKRYRYTWAQQVRSMMGTAVEGPQQGMVRLHIEIAPDGKLAKVDVLWSTSETAEKLALQAIHSLPPLPPTPTGKPLVFDKTIAFMPYETGWPPVYKYDCVPDPQSFHNPFAQNGVSEQKAQPAGPGTPPPRSTERSECPDAGPDSIEAEEKDMQRQFKEWGGEGRLNGVE